MSIHTINKYNIIYDCFDVYSVSQNKGTPNKKKILKIFVNFYGYNFLHDINICNVTYH